jgi:hypothetical protein
VYAPSKAVLFPHMFLHMRKCILRRKRVRNCKYQSGGIISQQIAYTNPPHVKLDMHKVTPGRCLASSHC